MKKKIEQWLDLGADPVQGIELIKERCSEYLIRIFRANPVLNKSLIRHILCFRYNVTENSTQRTNRNIREEFPFLNNSDCPLELKALVTDKFSTFYSYRDKHSELFDCSTLQQCASVSRELISSYKENRMIYRELEYYRDNKQILGNHPIFATYKRVKGYRSLSVKDLLKQQQKLKHNIWRISSEIKKGDKPHLDAKRQMELEQKEHELSEINRLLDE